jgi:hypothetical protein
LASLCRICSDMRLSLLRALRVAGDDSSKDFAHTTSPSFPVGNTSAHAE